MVTLQKTLTRIFAALQFMSAQSFINKAKKSVFMIIWPIFAEKEDSFSNKSKNVLNKNQLITWNILFKSFSVTHLSDTELILTGF